jgi:Leucine-rich repeat (LRR) protein
MQIIASLYLAYWYWECCYSTTTVLMFALFQDMARVLLLVLVLLHRTVAFCPRNCYCTRYWTKCSNAKLHGLPQEIINTTEELIIEWDNITELTEELFHHPGLQKIHTLVFDHTQILSIQKNTFQGMKQIKSLTVSNNQIERIPPESLHGLQMLEGLSFSSNEIHILHSRTFEGLTALTYLDLSDNFIEILSHDTFDGMRHVNDCKPVEPETVLSRSDGFLDLSFNLIVFIDPGTFIGLCMFTDLSLHNNNLSVLYSDTFQGLTRLKSLNLVGNSLKTIKTGSFSGLVYLSTLHTNDANLVGNDIETLHEGIFQGISRLGSLDLGYFGIHVIEEGVFKNFRFLTHLDLSGNEIKNLSSGIFHGLSSLRFLNLFSNKIKMLHIDLFEELSSLTDLDLAFNKIQTLLYNMFRGLVSLKTLTLYKNRIHTIKPGAFRGLIQLEHLDMRKNRINILTRDTFVDLVNLRILYLEENNIHTLEEHAFRDLKCLKILIISDNNITTVKNGTFYDLERVDELDLRNNNDLDLSPGALRGVQVLKKIGLTVRRGIDLSAGARDVLRGLLENVQTVQEFKVTGINTVLQPGMFTGLNLISLDLSENEITFIQPDTFVGMSSLRILIINHSKVQNILLGSFRHLNDLTELHLGINKIKSLKPGIFQGLTNLKVLNLISNRISSLNEGVFGIPCEEHIHNTCRYVTYLTSGMRFSQHNATCNMSHALTSLQRLDLSLNKLTSIHPHAFIHNTHLEILLLQGNRMLTLQTNFLYIPSLLILDISDCNISELPTDCFKCTPNLLELRVSFNRIEAISVELLKQTRDLEVLYMSGNPLVCDCQLKDILNWIIIRGIGTEENVLNMPCADVYDTWSNILPGLECNTSGLATYDPDTFTPDNLQFFKQYIEPIILGLILTIGALGNGLLLYIFTCHPELRTGPNACILNLAVGDCLSLAVNLPLSYWDNMNVSWELGLITCKVFMAARDLTVGITVFSVVALSAQRYSVASRSFQKTRGICGFSEHKTTGMLILLVWGLALGFAVPAFLTATVDIRCLYTAPDNEYIQRTYTIQLFIFCIIPVFVISFLNLMTAHHLKESIHNMPGERQATVQAEGRSRVANMVVVLTAVFCVSYLPNFLLRVLFVWSALEPDSELTSVISFISFCLFFCNSCFNPVALFSMSTTYKNLFFKHLQCGHTVSQDGPPLTQGDIPLRMLHASRKTFSQH